MRTPFLQLAANSLSPRSYNAIARWFGTSISVDGLLNFYFANNQTFKGIRNVNDRCNLEIERVLRKACEMEADASFEPEWDDFGESKQEEDYDEY